jgi:hypothetical protein
MSAYPAAAGQGLYDASATPKHEPGSVHVFADSVGDPIWARYMTNGYTVSIPAGLQVAHGDTYGEFITVFVSNGNPAGIAGGLAASCTSGGGAWVVFKGRMTNQSMVSSAASVDGWYALRPNGSGGLISEYSATAWPAYATSDAQVCAILENGTSATTGSVNSVTWLWR